MASLNQTFVINPRIGPAKVPAADRVRDFAEIHADFSPVAGTDQSSRCAQCGVPFCQTGCPLENNIPDWLRLAAEGRVEEAWRQSEATSTMPEIWYASVRRTGCARAPAPWNSRAGKR